MMEGLRKSIRVWRQKRHATVLERSRFFDKSWYVALYAAFIPEGEDAVSHYLASGQRSGFSPGPDFDAPAYLAANPDVAANNIEPLLHFTMRGAAENRQISAVTVPARTLAPVELSWFFDADWYQATYAGLIGGELAAPHYLAVGWQNGFSPGPRFDAPAYLDANPDVRDAGLEPLTHYLRSGLRQGRLVSSVDGRESIKRIYRALERPHLIDRDWYGQRYRAFITNGEDAISHYLISGRWSGFSPGPDFDAPAYLAANPEIAARNIEPLLHFATRGTAQGRHAGPVPVPDQVPEPIELSWFFDADWYERTYAGLIGDVSAIQHYLSTGWRNDFSPGPRFNAPAYLKTSPDVHAAGLEPLTHFLRCGLREGRSIVPVDETEKTRRLLLWSELFDARWYVDNHGFAFEPELAIDHYLTTGWRQGLAPGPWFDGRLYRFHYTDIGNGGIEPLEHFLRYGAMEGRHGRWFDANFPDEEQAMPARAADTILGLHAIKQNSDPAALQKSPLQEAVARIAHGRDLLQIHFHDIISLVLTASTIASGASRSRLLTPYLPPLLRERLLSVAHRLGVQSQVERHLDEFASASQASTQPSRWAETACRDWIVKANLFDRDLRNKIGGTDLVVSLYATVTSYEILRLLERLAYASDDLVAFDLPITKPFEEAVEGRTVRFEASDIWFAGDMDFSQSAAIARHWKKRGRQLSQYATTNGPLTQQYVEAEQMRDVWWWFVGCDALEELLELSGLELVELLPADSLDQSVLVLARKRVAGGSHRQEPAHAGALTAAR